MNKDDKKYSAYVQILEEELIPAMGCTEPIALAYAAAKSREVLSALPDRVEVQISGSIIKNVKSVIVPNTDNSKGIKVAVAAGIIANKPEKKLEVIADVTPEQTEIIKQYAANTPITVEHIEWGHAFDIVITAFKDSSYAKIRISDYHTNIVLIEKDGKVIYKQDDTGKCGDTITDRSLLNLRDIWDFATTCDINDVRELLERQIQCNTAIAEEGLKNDYGASIGRVLLAAYGDSDIRIRAKAKAAAGSDARMNGCEMPVVINSGSGNQGITCSVPVVEFARELGSSHEQLLRALVISNLVSIHEKTGIGTLSAYCGAVSAGTGAGTGIAYLRGGGLEAAAAVVTNTLATISGVVCDGAKASCASKISESVDMAILSYEMYLKGKVLQNGDGLVGNDVETTISNIARLGSKGMLGTNNEIIDMMIS